MALQNHDKVAPYITERDSEVLAYLTDIRSEVLTGDDRGFKLTYHFAENPFFTDKVRGRPIWVLATCECTGRPVDMDMRA